MDGTFTFYSDTQVANLRQKLDRDTWLSLSDETFTFAVTRNELDMPFSLGS